MKTETKIKLYNTMYRVSFVVAVLFSYGALIFKGALSNVDVAVAGIASIMTIVAFRKRDAVKFDNVVTVE